MFPAAGDVPLGGTRLGGLPDLPAQGLLSFFNELHDVHPREAPITAVIHSVDPASLRPYDADSLYLFVRSDALRAADFSRVRSAATQS
jgi:hypothetical protein